VTQLATYTLMNRHTPVLDFLYDLQQENFVEICEVHDLSYAPLMLTARGHEADMDALLCALRLWWGKRIVPASRPHMRQTLGYFYPGTEAMGEDRQGLDRKISQLARVNSGLSLSDQYWISDRDNPVSWDEINYFDNPFANDVGEAFFADDNSPTTALSFDDASPNYTLVGMMQKAWRCVDGRRLLYKSSRLEQQLVNELIATGLYRRLLSEDEFVHYSIEFENDKMYSVCENMLDSVRELVPALHLAHHYGFVDALKNYQGYYPYADALKNAGVPDVGLSLSKMIVGDYLLANTDRHWTNFGAIRNVETLEIERIAPLFDNGNSLYFNQMERFLKGEKVSFEVSHSFCRYPYEQLELVSCLDWFDAAQLEGFGESVEEVLLPLFEWAGQRGIEFVRHIVGDFEARVKTLEELQKDLSAR